MGTYEKKLLVMYLYIILKLILYLICGFLFTEPDSWVLHLLQKLQYSNVCVCSTGTATQHQ